MKLAIVVPCYNEESVISETTKQLTAVCEKIMEGGKIEEAFILYVDDGSQDATWAMIEEFSAASSVKGLKLAHNAGHQNALWAGLEWAAEHVDVAISIDADLQDDVAVILQMVEHYLAGNEIVYAVRKDRPNDTWFKKHSALFFYKLINNLGGDIVYNHADYRLMSRKALVALMLFPERNLFLRGMVRKLGFRHTRVYYDRRERFAGESKYPLGKMLSFALDGITSFSVRPLRFIVLLGILFMLIAFGAIVWGLFSYADGRALPGWTSLMVSVWFIGGAILTAMGIIGEYVGKLIMTINQTPLFVIR